MVPFNLIIHMTMFRKLNFWPLPKAPGGGGQKIVPVHVPFMWVTHTPNLVEFREIFFWPPHPPRCPQVPPQGMTQAAEWKSHLICYISFFCEKTHKVWLKIFEIDFVNEIYCNLMIFDRLAPPPGPRGRGQKNVPLHTPFMWATHTPNLVGFRPMV